MLSRGLGVELGESFCLRHRKETREKPSAFKKQLRNRFLLLMCFLLPRFSRAALWIGTTSFMILVLPVVFETEKLQMEQQQQLQQRQVRWEHPKPSPTALQSRLGVPAAPSSYRLLKELKGQSAICYLLRPRSSHQMLWLDVLMGQSCLFPVASWRQTPANTTQLLLGQNRQQGLYRGRMQQRLHLPRLRLV